MRRQAKPFTVEVKKSRKMPGEGAGSPREAAVEKQAGSPRSTLFSRAELEGISAPQTGPASRLWSDLAAATRGITTEEAAATPVEPASRILPDLRRREPIEVAEAEIPVPRAEREKPPRPAKVVRSPRRAPASRVVAPRLIEAPRLADLPVSVERLPPTRVVVRRRAKTAVEPQWRAGERWKRRLPRALW